MREYRMKLGKPFLTVQCSGGYANTLEVIEYRSQYRPQWGLAALMCQRRYQRSGIGLDETVVASGQSQHRGVFLTDTVKRHPPGGMEMELAVSDARKVQKRQLEVN